MFQMFGFGGVKCPRCEHKNAGDAGYCAQCGLTLGAPRSEPIFRDNRWIPGEHELAVFFGVRELSGLFVKTLRVPATTRAYILQGDKATEVPQGEYEIEGFFTRLNHLLRNQHAEILITRSAAMPVEFDFSELQTSERLQVGARFSISVRIEQISAFARHFMTMPGTITTEHLRELLAPSVRQLAAEFLASQSIREMSRNRDLRPQLDERLQGALKLRLAQYGLAVVQVDTLALRHDKFDTHRERIGSLWLVADERQVALDHAKQLDQLYDEQEWQAIDREQQETRVRLKREELRMAENVDKAELTLDGAERLHAVRSREIDLYARIAESRSRKQAMESGAGEMVSQLEHERAKKGAARADEAAEWAHLRELARIRMGTEADIARQEALEARQLAQQRFSHKLLQQQIQNKIDQALGIEDEAHKRDELARLHQRQREASEREAQIEAEEHTARWQVLAMANAARQHEAQRIEALEDAANRADLEQVSQKIDGMRRDGAQLDAIAQHEKLLRTIQADGVHTRQAHDLKQAERESEWQAELRRMDHARDERYAQLTHAADMARLDIARNESIGAMSDTAKLAVANASNAAVLADYMKTQVHAGMSAAQAAQLAREQVLAEQQRREAEVDKDRQHQLNLLKLQNDVNKAALSTQSELGVGVAGGAQRTASAARACPNGHRAAASARFCAECGAAIQP